MWAICRDIHVKARNGYRAGQQAIITKDKRVKTQTWVIVIPVISEVLAVLMHPSPYNTFFSKQSLFFPPVDNIFFLCSDLTLRGSLPSYIML